jgi:hypothetical protein
MPSSPRNSWRSAGLTGTARAAGRSPASSRPCAAWKQTLRRLDRAFQGFFQRVRAGRRAGYPRFKTVARWDSVDFMDRDGARWRAVEGNWAAAYFQGVGQVKVKAHRKLVGRVKTLRCKREGRRWYVIVVAEQQPVRCLPQVGRSAWTSESSGLRLPPTVKSCATRGSGLRSRVS